jgi:hypothetical protein
MRSFVSLVAVCSALNLFALQGSKPINLETVPAAATTQPAIPSVTFSSVGLVSSVQMTGTANWIFGSDQQSGTVTFQSNANGQGTMTLQLTAGSRIETQNAFSDSERQCTWSAVDAVAHVNAMHQCWLDAIWFLPQITMQIGAGAVDDVATVAQSPSVNTIRIHHERHIGGVRSVQTSQLISHLSVVDLDIDSSTGLPVQLSFAMHPDADAGLDIPVEIHYSAYSNFSGVTIPTHIQKFINHALVLDLQISTAQVQLAAPASVPSSSSSLQ